MLLLLNPETSRLCKKCFLIVSSIFLKMELYIAEETKDIAHLLPYLKGDKCDICRASASKVL